MIKLFLLVLSLVIFMFCITCTVSLLNGDDLLVGLGVLGCLGLGMLEFKIVDKLYGKSIRKLGKYLSALFFLIAMQGCAGCSRVEVGHVGLKVNILELQAPK